MVGGAYTQPSTTAPLGLSLPAEDEGPDEADQADTADPADPAEADQLDGEASETADATTDDPEAAS